MIKLTKNERAALLYLLKDFAAFYNANLLSKSLGISHVGTQKILKRLSASSILESEKIGKSIVYKLKLEDSYVCKLAAFLLADEANNFNRWKEEFKELLEKDRVVIMFGSALKNYSHARDIDIMIIMEKSETREVNAILREKEKVLPKKLHAIKLTQSDFSNSLKKKDKAMVDIVKNSIVLYGQDKYVEMIKDVSRF